MDILGPMRAADFLERMLGAETAFAPSIDIIKGHNDGNKCHKSKFKKGTFMELSVCKF